MTIPSCSATTRPRWPAGAGTDRAPTSSPSSSESYGKSLQRVVQVRALPRWFARNPITKHLGTAVFHDMHHENGAYNFGVYFTWWDRLMGTMHPSYVERYERVTERPLLWRPEPDGEIPATPS